MVYVYQDHFFHKAKKEGYLSRAVYKLEEIQKKYRILKKNSRVLDLGAAPGSWIQYTLSVIGTGGSVVAVDIKPLARIFQDNVVALQGDMTSPGFVDMLASDYGPFDVVLSDMAPDTMGNKHADSARSAFLVERALFVAERTLVRGGSFLAKIFQGEDTQELLRKAKGLFAKVKTVKPMASKKDSKEIYILGTNRKD